MKIFLHSILIASVCVNADLSAAELGRLFFTPEQRAAFTREQLHSSHNPAHSDTLKLNGIVQHHGGRRTAWINGIAQQTASSDAPHQIALPVPDQATPIHVKVGQQISLKAPQ